MRRYTDGINGRHSRQDAKSCYVVEGNTVLCTGISSDDKSISDEDPCSRDHFRVITGKADMERTESGLISEEGALTKKGEFLCLLLGAAEEILIFLLFGIRWNLTPIFISLYLTVSLAVLNYGMMLVVRFLRKKLFSFSSAAYILRSGMKRIRV